MASLHADHVDSADSADADLDAGGGDDSQSFDDDAALDTPEGDDAAADEATRSASADGGESDDEDDDDDRYEGLPAEERVKKLLSARKKLRRKLRERSPVYEQVQALARQGISLADLQLTHRQHQQLAEQIRRSPKLRSLIDGSADEGDRRPGRRDATRPAGDEEDFVFDDSPEALGFDPKESRTNQLLADRFRRAALTEHRLNKALTRMDRLDPDAIERRVGGLEQGIRQQSRQSIEREWTAAVDAAVTHITDPDTDRQKGLRTMFRDNMRIAMQTEGGKRPPQDIVNHYFRLLKITPARTARATAAARTAHQNAQRVTQLQRQPSQSGQPAPANAKRKTLADVHRQVRNIGLAR